MADSIINAAIKRESMISKLIEALEKKMDSFPDGRISVLHHKGGVHYIFSIENKRKYLNSHHSEMIESMIQKDYIHKVLISAKKESVALNRFIKSYPEITAEEVYEHLQTERKRIAKPIIIDDGQYAENWLAIPYVHKPFSKDAPKFYTQKGERVRSKSEVIIADRLFAKGIPYKYECPVKVGKKVFHPDLTILRLSDKKILYHEHCGKMGDPGYVNDMVERVNDYAHIGVYNGDRLFFTFESEEHPLDTSWLDDFIEKNYR